MLDPDAKKSASHIPVLLKEVLEMLSPKSGESVVDVTVGLGGHSEAFLASVGQKGRLIGLDADAENLALAQKNLAPFKGQIDLIHANFDSLQELDLPKFDIIFADLGLSSPHIDDPDRGFTFREDAPLDLRYNRDSGIPAFKLLAYSSEEDIAKIFWEYGELKQSRKIAKAIFSSSVKTTFDLKKCIEEACGFRAPSVLPQVFQALRIAVNDELSALKILLENGPSLLNPGGRMGVISYHSLEDRIVKQAFRSLSTAEKDPNTGADIAPAPFEILTKKPIMPSDEEMDKNSRSRSAKFRVIRRI